MFARHSAYKTSLNGVECVLVARRTFADDMADEPRLDVDGDENRQAYEDKYKHHSVEYWSLTYPERAILLE